MKLKRAFRLSFTFFLVFLLAACNNDSDDYVQEESSKDAQIYAFTLKGKAMNAADSITYPILAKTKFAIDQASQLIYNPDSLPYKTRIDKFFAVMTFSSAGISQVQLLYPNDSVANWTTTDSLDFSTRMYPQIRVTAPDAFTSLIYTIDLRVHQVNPDLLVWKNMTEDLDQPTSIIEQKTLLIDDTFYTFSKNDDNKLYLYQAEKSESYGSGESIKGLPVADINLNNIMTFNGKFFATDNQDNGYSSEDGIEWTKKDKKIIALLGVLPAPTQAGDSLLVVTENNGVYSFTKTLDLENFGTNTSLKFTDLHKEKFPLSGFSSLTNYNRENLNQNILSVTGGKKEDGGLSKLTWNLQVAADNSIRVIANQDNPTFEAKEGIPTFFYNGYMYALVSNKLYKTDSFGYKWIEASEFEALDPTMPKGYGQSVVVDKDNYIWIFGGKSSSDSEPIHQVWRGRLNKLNPRNW